MRFTRLFFLTLLALVASFFLTGKRGRVRVITTLVLRLVRLTLTNGETPLPAFLAGSGFLLVTFLDFLVVRAITAFLILKSVQSSHYSALARRTTPKMPLTRLAKATAIRLFKLPTPAPTPPTGA